MDYFGCSLWRELLAGNRDWFDTLDLGHPDHFDPDAGGFDEMFSRLARVIDAAGMRGRLGGCFHVSSEFIAILERFDLIDAFNRAKAAFSKQVPFQLGMHCTFGNDDLPLGPRYARVLKRDVHLAGLAGATCIVAHPPRDLQDRSRDLTALLASPAITATLEDTTVAVHWENLGPDCHFGSPAALLAFREALRQALERTGTTPMINRHRFCLDTGHLLLYRARGPGTIQDRDAEIEAALSKMAADLGTFHIHANDGTADHHVVPGPSAFLDHPSRAGINRDALEQNGQIVMAWLRACERAKGTLDRHVHVEALRLPFSLDQLVMFGKAWLAAVGSG